MRRKPIEGRVFLPALLIACLTVVGWRVSGVSDPGAPRLHLKTQLQGSGKSGRTLLADRTETDDSVTYTTDPKAERQTKKEEREEKGKERNSWKMLQHMYLYGPAGKRPPPAQQGATPSQ